MDFNDLIGEEVSFYGVDMNEFKLGDTVFEAIEDESDGYRSYLGSIEVKDSNDLFFPFPLATVKIEEFDDGYTEGIKLVDVSDAHEWLIVGTSNYNDYYPYFVFDYKPKDQEY